MKLATIGRGFIVDRAIDALKDVPQLELEAVYSRNQEDALEFARRHGVAKAYSNMEEMLADPQIDVVYIASPNTLHYPQARMALEAGKHVILEKPFVSSRQQAEELFRTAREHGVKIFEAITTEHTDNFRRLQEQLEKAGDIRQVTLNFSQHYPRYDQYKEGIIPHVFDPAFDGGALMDLNVYNIHFATALFGKPAEVIYYPNLGFNGIDTSGVLLMRYPGFSVSAIAAMDAASPYFFVISGEKGTFQVDQGSIGRMNHVTFQGSEPGQPSGIEEISIPHRNHMSFEFRDFARILEQGDEAAYEKWREQTLLVQDILDEARRQRDGLAQAVNSTGLSSANA